MPNGPRRDPPGGRGITPHINLNVQGPASMTTATYTSEDAAAFVLAHPPFARVPPDAPYTVVSVVFRMKGVAFKEFNFSTLPHEPNRLVCVVKLQGRFMAPQMDASALSREGRLLRPPAIHTTVYVVFDGKTGNVLARKITDAEQSAS